jgi:hypothetical protein
MLVGQTKGEGSMSGTKRAGFTLTELISVGLGVGAGLLTVVLPEPSRDLLASNERAAIAALRQVASAQAQLTSSGAIDTDNDGVGEYGYLGELAGTAPLRIYDPATGSPTIVAASLSPALLPPAFANILNWLGDDVVRKDGYYFRMFLPDAPVLNEVRGIAESGPDGFGGATFGRIPSPDTCEVLWGCYAWPVEAGVTGRRVFFINQEGRVLQTTNNGRSPGKTVYGGLRPLASIPVFDAAYSSEPGSSGFTGMGAQLGTPPRRANDGNVWTPID